MRSAVRPTPRRGSLALVVFASLIAACTHPAPTTAGVQAQLSRRLSSDGFSAVVVEAEGVNHFTGSATNSDGTVFDLTAFVRDGKLSFELRSTISRATTDAAGSVTTTASDSVRAGTIPYDG